MDNSISDSRIEEGGKRGRQQLGVATTVAVAAVLLKWPSLCCQGARRQPSMSAAVGWCMTWNSERGLPAGCATTCPRQCIAGMIGKRCTHSSRAVMVNPTDVCPEESKHV